MVVQKQSSRTVGLRHVRTPDGKEMPVFGEDLGTEVGRRYGAPVEMMQLNHGFFDEASISVILFDTVREIGANSLLTSQKRCYRRRPKAFLSLCKLERKSHEKNSIFGPDGPLSVVFTHNGTNFC